MPTQERQVTDKVEIHKYGETLTVTRKAFDSVYSQKGYTLGKTVFQRPGKKAKRDRRKEFGADQTVSARDVAAGMNLIDAGDEPSASGGNVEVFDDTAETSGNAGKTAETGDTSDSGAKNVDLSEQLENKDLRNTTGAEKPEETAKNKTAADSQTEPKQDDGKVEAAETAPPDGKVEAADNSQTEPTSAPETLDLRDLSKGKNTLPADIPYRQELTEAGIVDFEELKKMSYSKLRDKKGITAKQAKSINAWFDSPKAK